MDKKEREKRAVKFILKTELGRTLLFVANFVRARKKMKLEMLYPELKYRRLYENQEIEIQQQYIQETEQEFPKNKKVNDGKQ